ncbi:MAG: XRE family transcriptional regulator [Endomicrobia bacterium]|nr:XRE family transcriptional regulator [Endomicrobiia bacterium]MCL2507153.1 XRE family transcriptional regulator [Endomicrobiia bacterium]
MNEQLKDIGLRLSGLRNIAEMTPEAFCEKTGITVQDLAAYEKGELDFSFSFLYKAAKILGVDVIDLMSGDSPHLSDWTIVRKGEGYSIDRRAAYKYNHLAFTFRNKKAEPFMVTVEPKEEKPSLQSHDGQEFNLMISGRMKFYIANSEYVLEPGDSVYFNSSIPHAMQALDNAPVKFLAVVIG